MPLGDIRTKKELDDHVADLFAKLTNEKEKSLRCWGFAKSYFGIREYATARRYLERYIESQPNNLGEAYKLMGDIYSEENNLERALSYYKSAYENGKQSALSYVCDLLRNGVGYGETEESKQKWFERHRLTASANLSTISSSSSSKSMYQNPYSNGLSSSNLSMLTPRVRSPAVPVTAIMANGSFYQNGGSGGSGGTAGGGGTGDSSYGFKTPPECPELFSPNDQNNQTSTPKVQRIYPSPTRIDYETVAQSKAVEEKLQQTLDQNKVTLDRMSEMLEEIKNLRIEVNELKQNQSASQLLQQSWIQSTLNNTSTCACSRSPVNAKKSETSYASTVTEQVKPVSIPAAGRATTTTAVTSAPKPLSEMFKKPEGSWDCRDCYTNNKKESNICVACNAPNPNATTTPTTMSPAKPAAETASPFASFSFKPVGFGDLASNSSTTNIFATSGSNTGFTGFAGAGQPLFGGFNSNTSPPKKSDAQEEKHAEGNEDEPDDFVPTAEFTPVIPLPPLVEVKKGDEDDNLIHEVRAKLFRFDTDTKEWKERGIGNIKIVQNKIKLNQIRVLMWRERVLKLACNHLITKDMVISFAQKSDKFLTWTAMDYSEPGDGRLEKFLCKFSNEQQCSEFKKQFENSVELLKTLGPSPTSTPSKIAIEPAPPTMAKAEEKSEPAQDLTDSKTAQTTEKNECSTTPCPGCRGCDPDTFDFSKLDNRSLPTYPEETMTVQELLKTRQSTKNTNTAAVAAAASPLKSQLPSVPIFGLTPTASAPQPPTTTTAVTSAPKPLSEMFKKPEGSWDCRDCYTNNKKESNICVACNAPNPNATTTPTTMSPAKPAAETASPFASFSFKPVGFGDLASNSSTTNIFATSGSNTGFTGFAGAGQPLFGGFTSNTSPPKKSDAQEEKHAEGNEDEPDDFVPTAEFTPVIPLPPLVEVKKGDEDDNLIHEVRAKLYRFDTDTKEWKERGIGNIKIVQNKIKLNQIRVLMWRERVLKLACNHLITKDMVISFAQKSDKFLTWTAMDYSEPGDGRLEKFLCKFSNEQQCSEFKKQFENSVELLKTLGATSTPSKIAISSTGGN